MDYRCPVCGANLERRKLSQAIVAHMEIDCSYCKSRIRTNVHRAEVIIVLLNFATVIALATSAYWSQSQGLLVGALGAAVVGAGALPVLERTYLRAWPRYASIVKSPELM